MLAFYGTRAILLHPCMRKPYKKNRFKPILFGGHCLSVKQLFVSLYNNHINAIFPCLQVLWGTLLRKINIDGDAQRGTP